MKVDLPVRERIVAMEGMRGFAVALVFLVHFETLFGHLASPNLNLFFKILASFGNVGVDVFFLLSGYLMYGALFNPRFQFGQYLLRRMKRLYPTFVTVFLIYAVLSFWGLCPSKIPAGFTSGSLYLLANLAMLPGMTNIDPLIAVSWSLSYEWFFYLCLPLLFWAGALRRRSQQWRIVFFVSLAVGYSVACLLGIAVHPRLIMFASGILLWEVQKRGMFKLMPARGEYLVIAVFLLNLLLIGLMGARYGPLAGVLARMPLFRNLSIFISAFLFTAYALFHEGILNFVFSWKSLRWMGNISYSYYLIHGLTLQGVRLMTARLLPAAPLSPFLFGCLALGCVAATLVTSSVLYDGIEKPLSIDSRGSIWLRKVHRTLEAVRSSC